MRELRQIRRSILLGSVLVGGVLSAVAFNCFRPFDAYLLSRWESQLATLDDGDVEIRVEQIGAFGERSFPTLAAALHSDRKVVAASAGAVLRRKLDELALRSTDESSRAVARLARALAARSDHPGPHAPPFATQLALRLLQWPIHRSRIDGPTLVADCERIIRSAEHAPRETAADGSELPIDEPGGLLRRDGEGLASRLPSLVTGSDTMLPVITAPPLPPLAAQVAIPTTTSTDIHPPPSIAPATTPSLTPAEAEDRADKISVANQTSLPGGAVEPRKRLELRRDLASASGDSRSEAELRSLPDLVVIQLLGSEDESLVREALDELYRRGFQTRHVQLAEMLADPDASVRYALVRRLPQLAGIDSRPWLLWLCRDPDPTVRKAAVGVIATSSDAGLRERVRELEREETDADVLRVVRQVLSSESTDTIR